MALWAIMAAPLLMSNDLREICPRSKELLQNKHIIAISQDPLGKQGYLTVKVGVRSDLLEHLLNVHSTFSFYRETLNALWSPWKSLRHFLAMIFMKSCLMIYCQENKTSLGLQVDNFEVWERPLLKNRLAIAVLNKQEIGGPRGFLIRAAPGWKICDPQCNVTQILPQYKEMGVQAPQSKMVLSVNPSGTALLTVTPISSPLKGLYKLHWQDTSVKRKQTLVL